MSENICTFERVLRKCQHNENLTRDGVKRGYLYDFKVLVNGQHVAWWQQYGVNNSTDTNGYRYWLVDLMGKPIPNGMPNHRDRPVSARSRDEFETVTLANLHRIPSEEELAQRKLDIEQNNKKREEDEEKARQLHLAQLAAPDMLTALKALLGASDFDPSRPITPEQNRAIADAQGLAQAAIAKAEGGQ